MTKIFIGMHTGYCGSEAYEVLDVDYTKEELADPNSLAVQNLDEISYEMARENYSRYGFDEYDDDSEVEEDNCYGFWEIYDAEKHNGHLTQCQIGELE